MIYSAFITTLVLFLFFAITLSLGKWFQDKFNLFISNPFMAFIVGFILFFFITIMSYLPPIIFRLSVFWFISIEIIKDIILIIFLWINRKSVRWNLNWGRIGLSILVGIALINITFAVTNKEAFSSTTITNQIFNHAFSENPRDIKSIYNSWYMFNSIMIYVSKVSIKANVYWFQGIIISVLFSSTIFAYCHALKRSPINWIKYLGLPIIILGWLAANTYKGWFSVNAGIPVLLMILVLIGWELTARPQLRTFGLSAATGATLLTFETSTIYIFSFYFIVVLIIYIWWCKPKVFALIIIHLIIIGFSATILLNTFSPLVSTLSLVGFSIFILIMFVFRKQNLKHDIDAYFYRSKKFIVPFLIFVIFISSIIVWSLSPEKYPNFGLNLFRYKIYNHNQWPSFVVYLIYVFYFIITSLGLFIMYRNFKYKRDLSVGNFLNLLGTVSTLLLFMPWGAPVIQLIIGDNFWKFLPWITMVPIIISVPMNIYRAQIQ